MFLGVVVAKLDEIVKLVRTSHQICYVITAAACALLLSPRSEDYAKALSEAHCLKGLRMADYEEFAKMVFAEKELLPYRKGMASGDYEQEITHFIGEDGEYGVYPGRFPNPTSSVDEMVTYLRPPTNGSLKDWLQWVQSTENAKVYVPDWSKAGWHNGRSSHPAKPIVRHFSVQKSDFRSFEGNYRFRAYLDYEITENDKSEFGEDRSKRKDWWTELDSINVDELIGPEKQEQRLLDDRRRFVIEGDVVGVPKEIQYPCGIRNWLEFAGQWKLVTRTDTQGETVFPGLVSHWSEIADKPLDDAIAFMENKMQSVSDISLLGIQIPGRFGIIAIPLAFSLVLTEMLIHLRAILKKVRAKPDEQIDAPWIGLYPDLLASLTTWTTIVVLPIALSLMVIVRFYAIVSGGWSIVGLAATFTCLGIGYSGIREADSVKRALVANAGQNGR